MEMAEHRIVVTPTTSGFRHTLKEKAIGFSLPLKTDLMFVNFDQDDCPKDFQPVDDDVTVDLDHDEWLKDIGISPRRTLKLNRSASALDVSTSGKTVKRVSSNLFGGKASDEKEDQSNSSLSTILIQGAENINAFYELITTSKLGSTRTGPQSGLPPTLIASSHFYKSTAQELTMTSQVVRKDGEIKYTLELDNGAVLPFVPEMLMEFVKKAIGPSENSVQMQINGRAPYTGINEALAESTGQQLVNFSELEFVGSSVISYT